MTAAHAVSHRECDLGKWLYADGLRLYGEIGSLQEMEAVHQQMHGYIGDLIHHQNQGDSARAAELFGQVEECSDRVVNFLTKVEQELADR